LGAGQAGAAQQLRQCQQRPRFIGPFLPVDLLEADDVGGKPDDLRPHQLNPPGQRRPLTYSGLIKVLEINVAIRTSAIKRPLSPISPLPRYLGSSQLDSARSTGATIWQPHLGTGWSLGTDVPCAHTRRKGKEKRSRAGRSHIFSGCTRVVRGDRQGERQRYLAQSFHDDESNTV
jgi:hypothetical protein